MKRLFTRNMFNFSLVAAILILNGCSSMMTLRTQDLNISEEEYSEQIITNAVTEGQDLGQRVGKATFTVFAIPVGSVYLTGDGNKQIMDLVRDALKQVGYEVIIADSREPSEVPRLICKIERFWFKNYTWFAPFIKTWGGIQLEVNLLSQDGKVVWTQDFFEKAATWKSVDAFSNVANVCMLRILNKMVNAFSSREFHSVLVEYSS